MKRERISFVVTVDAPYSYTKTDVAYFIRDAVRSYGGQRQPEDELFDLCRTATVKGKPEKTLGTPTRDRGDYGYSDAD